MTVPTDPNAISEIVNKAMLVVGTRLPYGFIIKVIHRGKIAASKVPIHRARVKSSLKTKIYRAGRTVAEHDQQLHLKKLELVGDVKP